MSAVLEQRTRAEELARGGRLVVRRARAPHEIEAAQRLRWQVFVEEMGARIDTPRVGLDVDRFDAFCEHLIVEDETTGDVVGTYRVLLPEQARHAGGLYVESEFSIDRLHRMRPGLVELGRSCVRRDYRTGGAILLLWTGLGELLADRGHRWLIGCASVADVDGGRYAASLWRRLWADHAAPESYRVFPKRPLAVDTLAHDVDTVVPPLLKGYLRAGAMLLGEPHVDRAFGCVDVPVLVELDRLTSRYSRRFLRA